MKWFQGATASGAMNEQALRRVASELIDHFKTIECWMLKDGAEELVTSLLAMTKPPARKELALGIVSNFDPRLYHLLKIFDMSDAFDPIILSHEHQVSKPSPDIFQLALNHLNKTRSWSIKPEEALHVGDNYELDYVGAVKSGWRSCLITSNFNSLEIPESSRDIVPSQQDIFPDLNSFHRFLGSQGKYSIWNNFTRSLPKYVTLARVNFTMLHPRIPEILERLKATTSNCCWVAIRVN